MTALALPGVEPELLAPLSPAARADADRLVRRFEDLQLRARIDGDRRIVRLCGGPWGKPINGRETKAQAAAFAAVHAEELAKRRPEAAWLLRKFARRHGVAALPAAAATPWRLA